MAVRRPAPNNCAARLFGSPAVHPEQHTFHYPRVIDARVAALIGPPDVPTESVPARTHVVPQAKAP